MKNDLNLQGLKGRVLNLPAKGGTGRQLLLLYGHHSSLERWTGLAQAFSEFGVVTMPDLPGFGGMDSFYKIGKKPTLDNFADYLAEFVRQNFADTKVTIVGMSFGFAVTTRMLQRHPELTGRVDRLISLVGFASIKDFNLKPLSRWLMRLMGVVFSQPVLGDLWRLICLNRFWLNITYIKLGHPKFRGLSPEQQKAMLETEIDLWRVNDIRTHMFTIAEGQTLDNTTKRIDLPVWNLSVSGDHLLNNQHVESSMRQIFSDYHSYVIEQNKHAPTIMTEAEARAVFVNPWIQDLLK